MERVTKQIFADWIQENKTQMYRLTLCIVKNEADTEHVVCETIVKAYEHLDELRNPAQLAPWIMTILYNDAQRMYAKRKKEASRNGTELSEIELPEEGMELWRAVLKLDSELQTVAVLHYYLRYDTKDIAQILHVSGRTVRSRVDRIRMQLRDLVEYERSANDR